ncbi:MAG: hypothetical protein IJC31_02540 [Spirochaetaceae bacterium]|nr:hypothetical protein [Spirochaetaceae bacterium]
MKIKYIFPLLLVLFAFACKNELTIFEQINEETKLEEAEIKGSVNSIVKFKEKLYATDGNIYSKNIDVVRGWGATAGPGGNIYKLASNETNLYALNEQGLFTTTDGSAWNKVDVSETISSIETIFDNGLDAAYIHGTAKGASETSYFKLEGTTANSTDEVSSIVVLKTDKGIYTAAKDGTVTGSNDLGSVPDLGTVYSLTHSQVDNAIYAGTSKGLKKLPVEKSSGKLTGENLAPPGNPDATIKSYEAFAVLATGTKPNDSALYTSTISSGSDYSKINGLWGYYYSRRDTWNRE